MPDVGSVAYAVTVLYHEQATRGSDCTSVTCLLPPRWILLAMLSAVVSFPQCRNSATTHAKRSPSRLWTGRSAPRKYTNGTHFIRRTTQCSSTLQMTAQSQRSRIKILIRPCIAEDGFSRRPSNIRGPSESVPP